MPFRPEGLKVRAFFGRRVEVPKDCSPNIAKGGGFFEDLRQHGTLHPKVRSATSSLAVHWEKVYAT